MPSPATIAAKNPSKSTPENNAMLAILAWLMIIFAMLAFALAAFHFDPGDDD